MQSRKLLRVAARTIIGLLIIAFVGISPTYADPGDETLYYLLTDHLGSVDVVLDEQGNVVERRDYLPYGSERTSETNPDSPSTPQKFTGKELDDETGLYYYGARYFDPLIGRFVQIDPLLLGIDQMSQEKRNAFLSDPQNLNAYAYVQNNPVKYTDPTGMWGVATGLGGKSHQFITGMAIDNANICLTKKVKDTLVFSASIWADILVYNFENKKSYNHSTSQGDSMNALQIKEAMMTDAKQWYTSGYLDNFGRLLHMVEDSYTSAHTERDNKGNITAFLDFEKQPLLLHLKYDNYKGKNGKIRPEALQATTAATKLINYYYSGTDWSEVANYLDKGVLKGVNKRTKVGIAGKKFRE